MRYARYLIAGVFCLFIFIFGAAIGSFLTFHELRKEIPQETWMVIEPTIIPAPIQSGPTPTYYFGKPEIYPSHRGEKAVIYMKDDRGEDMLLLTTKNKIELFDRTMLPGKVEWSEDDAKVAYTSGTPSLGTHVSIADLETGKSVFVEADHDAFQSSVENKADLFGHMYSYNVAWIGNEYVISGVTGNPDYSDRVPPYQYYLIDAKTGKVVKRIL
jgi:hypothetical protein